MYVRYLNISAFEHVCVHDVLTPFNIDRRYKCINLLSQSCHCGPEKEALRITGSPKHLTLSTELYIIHKYCYSCVCGHVEHRAVHTT